MAKPFGDGTVTTAEVVRFLRQNVIGRSGGIGEEELIFRPGGFQDIDLGRRPEIPLFGQITEAFGSRDAPAEAAAPQRQGTATRLEPSTALEQLRPLLQRARPGSLLDRRANEVEAEQERQIRVGGRHAHTYARERVRDDTEFIEWLTRFAKAQEKRQLAIRAQETEFNELVLRGDLVEQEREEWFARKRRELPPIENVGPPPATQVPVELLHLLSDGGGGASGGR